jgi:hypothetical protein
MAPTCETRRAGGAAGLGEMSFLDGIDARENLTTPSVLQARRRARRQRLVEHLHRLGPCPLDYFVREIEGGADIDSVLLAYRKIDPGFVRAFGGDQFPPVLHALDGGAP